MLYGLFHMESPPEDICEIFLALVLLQHAVAFSDQRFCKDESLTWTIVNR